MATETQDRAGASGALLIDPDDAERLEKARSLVAQYLHEAHAIETALVTTLQTHIGVTPRGPYRQLLERHLAETRQHAAGIERRLDEMGEGTGLVDTAVGLVQNLLGQLVALSKAPIDVLRGASGQEKLLKNARDECASEALEIAAYDGLEHAARAVGDDKTAELAQRHRSQEEDMLAGLREEIPNLARATVRERVGGEELYDPGSTGAAENVRELGERARRFAREGESGADAGLPVPGYDRLNAGEVVERLPELSDEELRAVGDYERSNRNRPTVLRRVDELHVQRGSVPEGP
jgi:ferritin-like metal-binding protein YciE